MNPMPPVAESERDLRSSADFWRVGSAIRPLLPSRLHHRQVFASSSAGSEHFSTERKHPVHIVDLPSHTLSMTIGGLLPGQRTSRHRHNYETIIYVMEGHGMTLIEERTVEWHAGDAIYVPVWAWHEHVNLRDDASCLYVACENAALLQNLGGIALREEAR